MHAGKDRTVFFDGQFYLLSPLEYDVFTLLMLYDGEVLSRDKLLRDVWGYLDDASLSTRSVDMCILRLRNKIGMDRIQTVYGKGYRLVL